MHLLRRVFSLGVLAALAACSDNTAPPKPAALILVTPPPTSAQVGSAVVVTVVVNDETGKPMSGQPLSVTAAGGGTVSGIPSTTQGATALTGWTLGTKVGANTLTVVSGSLPPLIVSVAGTAGPAATLTATLPPTATVGQTIAVVVGALDLYQNPVPGAAIALTTTGGGSIAPVATTDANGAAVVQWALGTLVGANDLRLSAGTATATFSITPKPDVPNAVEAVRGDNQAAAAGSPLLDQLQLKVTDRFGNVTPQQPVTFTVAAGGGSLSGVSTISTDASGLVTSPNWTLGKRNIPQKLAVNVGPVARLFNATIRTSYRITLRYIGSTTEEQRAIFEGAAARVSAAISAGAGPVTANAFPLSSACGLTGLAPLSEVIDGIVIYAGITPIDGAGKILAQSGPCGFRSASSNYLPALAIIQFDEADLAKLTNGGSLEDVATHEMFHSIGYGTLWTTFGFVVGSALDPRYLGFFGNGGCAKVATPLICGTSVPLENVGGAGTVGGHWRESIFANELLTGYLNAGANPLSVMTIEAMKDLGYSVSSTASDTYSQAAGLRASRASTISEEAWERLFTAPTSELVPSGGLLVRRRFP